MREKRSHRGRRRMAEEHLDGAHAVERLLSETLERLTPHACDPRPRVAVLLPAVAAPARRDDVPGPCPSAPGDRDDVVHRPRRPAAVRAGVSEQLLAEPARDGSHAPTPSGRPAPTADVASGCVPATGLGPLVLCAQAGPAVVLHPGVAEPAPAQPGGARVPTSGGRPVDAPHGEAQRAEPIGAGRVGREGRGQVPLTARPAPFLARFHAGDVLVGIDTELASGSPLRSQATAHRSKDATEARQ